MHKIHFRSFSFLLFVYIYWTNKDLKKNVCVRGRAYIYIREISVEMHHVDIVVLFVFHLAHSMQAIWDRCQPLQTHAHKHSPTKDAIWLWRGEKSIVNSKQLTAMFINLGFVLIFKFNHCVLDANAVSNL